MFNYGVCQNALANGVVEGCARAPWRTALGFPGAVSAGVCPNDVQKL